MMLMVPLLALFSLGAAFSADVDGDGVGDIEEIYEYGTDPHVADIDVLYSAAEVRIASLPEVFTLHGTSLLMTGFAPRQAGSVEFQLQNKEGVVRSVLRLPTDARGVFNGIWDLRDVCAHIEEQDFTLVGSGNMLHKLTLLCADAVDWPLDQMTFAGLDRHRGQADAVALNMPGEAVFTAKADVGTRLYAAYASVVFSKDLFASEDGGLRIAPWRDLPPGDHTLYLMPYNPMTQDLYAPMAIPFTVLPPMSEQWMATVQYAPEGLVVIGLIFAASLLLIRRFRPKHARTSIDEG